MAAMKETKERTTVANYLSKSRREKEAFQAARNGNLQKFKALIKSGINIDISGPKGEKFITTAASEGNWGIVEFCLKMGAPVDTVDDKGGTPIFYATVQNNLPMVKRLHRIGANINQRINTLTLLMQAVVVGDPYLAEYFCDEMSQEVVRNARDKNDWTALDFALSSEEDTADMLVFELLRAGAQPPSNGL